MEKEKITIIVPVYNVEKYLDDCIRSILRQTYKNIEIILVDDGSTDRSGKICDKYADTDDRICVIHKKNGGLSDARNVALEIFSGDYVTFVDSDDYVSETYVEILYNASQVNNADMVITSDSWRFADGKVAKLYSGSIEGIKCYSYTKEQLLEHLFYQKTHITGAQGKLYAAALFKKTDIRFPYGMYYEDLATTYKCVLASHNAIMIDCKIYAYRIRNDGIIHQKFSEKKMACIPISQQLYMEIYQKKPELSVAAASRCLSVNRSVYSQVPYRFKRDREQLWKEIIKYRKMVLFDNKARKKERLGCVISYFGQPIYHIFNHLFLLYKNSILKR